MWEVKIEASGYNRLTFKFDDLESASKFLETAQEHSEDILGINIKKLEEGEE